jgi:hypothetical protein
MNQIVDLAEAYKSSSEKRKVNGIENFLNECVQQNKAEIVKSIMNLKQYDFMFVIETFAFRILSGMFAHKTQTELINIIESGSIFLLKDRLVAEFLADEEINSCVNVVCV